MAWVGAVQHPSGRVTTLSYPTYQLLRDRSTSFSGLLAYSETQFALGGQNPSVVEGSVVSGNYFDVLGVRASRGRLLMPSDDRPAAPRVAVLSDAIWHRAFAADPSVVGAPLSINGQPFTVVGIGPADFEGVEFGERNQLWVPLSTVSVAIPDRHDQLTDPLSLWLEVLGRLQPESSLSRAQAELSLIIARAAPASIAQAQRPTAAVTGASGDPPWIRRHIAPAIGLVSLVPLCVMLVACTNVANAVMARHVERQREFATRRAIGATRARLLTQLFAEALLLAALAAIAGFVLSSWLTILVARLGGVPSVNDTALLIRGPRTVAVTGLVALLSTLVFGLVPAIRATQTDILPALKDESVATTTNRRGRRLRNIFIVTQVALSFALLVASGLFLQSLGKALRVDTGFTPQGAVSVKVDPYLQGYSDSQRTTLVDRMIAATRAVPGVTAVGVTTVLPLGGAPGLRPVSKDGVNTLGALASSVTPGLIGALGVPIVDGRPPTNEDTADAPPVVIVNQSLAARLWPRQRAVGQYLIEDTKPGRQLAVVGVVGDMKYADLTESPRVAYYIPYAQAIGRRASPVLLVARTKGDEAALLRILTGLVQAIDPNMPVSYAETLSETVHDVAATQQAVASFLAVFGALTLLLTAIGIYGVAAHSASLRTREVGIRVALGARASDIRRLFIRESVAISAIGVAVGLVVSAAGSRLLESYLYGLTATDAMTFFDGALALCVVTVLASYGPARGVARTNPILALKHE